MNWPAFRGACSRRFRPRQTAVAAGLCALLALQVASCARSEPTVPSASATATIDPAILTSLLGGLETDGQDPSRDVQALLAGTRGSDRTDPNWPALAYLLGETQRRRGDLEGA